MPAVEEPTHDDTVGTSTFAREVEALLRNAEESIPPVKVLIWGPAENPEDPWWKKRVQIRDELRKQGYEAAFSEELPAGVGSPGDARAFALKTAEFAHAKVADYIILLMASVGSVAEAHDFGARPELARKMTIFIDRKHASGYAADSFILEFEGASGKVHWVKVPEDLDECHVLTTTLKAVAGIREIKRFNVLDGFDVR